MDHTTTPLGKCTIFLEPKFSIGGFGDDLFSFSFWMIFGSVFVFGGVTNNPSNPWGIPRSWAHQTHVYAILRLKKNTALHQQNETNCSMDFKTSEVWYVSKGKNTTRSWSVGSSNWVPPDPTSQKISWASCSPKVSVKRKQCWQSFVKPRCFRGWFLWQQEAVISQGNEAKMDLQYIPLLLSNMNESSAISHFELSGL